MMINLQSLLDDAKCYETVRQLRWPEGVRCPHCGVATITQQDGIPPSRRGRNIAVKAAIATLTISRVPCWLDIINRCGFGFYVCISWD